MNVQRTSAGAPWEQEVGYCRAIRAGDLIQVTGTAPLAEDGSVFAPGDAYAQVQRCLAIIERALADLGGGLADVVRTRMFVTDISRWAEYGGAHPPATTLVEVRALIDPEMLIEIEADVLHPDAAR